MKKKYSSMMLCCALSKKEISSCRVCLTILDSIEDRRKWQPLTAICFFDTLPVIDNNDS